jgi:hypothetical protein
MSQENMAVIRSVYEAFNRGDWDAVFRDLPPDFDLPYEAVVDWRFCGA